MHPTASASARLPRRPLSAQACRTVLIALVLVAAWALPAAAASQPEPVAGGPTGSYLVPAGIHKIRHVVVVMQENRSFDSYFGTYPGADGIPMSNGVPTTCNPDPKTRTCVQPFHGTQDRNGGGPHGNPSAMGDIDGGKMDGFAVRQRISLKHCTNPSDPACSASRRILPDVTGLPQRGRDPELLGVRPELRPAGPHVRAGELVVAPPTPLPRLWLVRPLRGGSRSGRER